MMNLRRYSMTSVDHVFHFVEYLACPVFRRSHTDVESNLDALKSYLMCFDPDEFGSIEFLSMDFGRISLPRSHRSIEPRDLPSELRTISAFWSGCVENKFFDYVTSFVEKLQPSAVSCWIIGMLMYSMWPRLKGPALWFTYWDEETFNFFASIVGRLTDWLFLLRFKDLDKAKAPSTHTHKSIAIMTCGEDPYTVIYSWLNIDEDEDIMASMMLLLVSAWLFLLGDLDKTMIFGPDLRRREVSPMLEQAICLLDKCLVAMDVYIGHTSERFPFEKRCLPHISTLVSSATFPTAGLFYCIPHSGTPYNVLDLHIVCADPGSSPDDTIPCYISWDVLIRVKDGSLGNVIEYIHTRSDRRDEVAPILLKDPEFRASITNAVERNASGQLDAWQQRYLLACIRVNYGQYESVREAAELESIISERMRVVGLSESPVRLLIAGLKFFHK